jgi:hypothetical protein
VLPVIHEIQASGIQSLRGVARAGSSRNCDGTWWRMGRGIATARGGVWDPRAGVRHFASRLVMPDGDRVEEVVVAEDSAGLTATPCACVGGKYRPNRDIPFQENLDGQTFQARFDVC